MWQNDTVTFQTKTEVNTAGSIKQTWVPGSSVLCDVQDINKEKVHKAYGLTDANQFKQVFDHTMDSKWTEGEQVLHNSFQWLIRLIDGTEGKMGLSNHTYIIMSKVV